MCLADYLCLRFEMRQISSLFVQYLEAGSALTCFFVDSVAWGRLLVVKVWLISYFTVMRHTEALRIIYILKLDSWRYAMSIVGESVVNMSGQCREAVHCAGE